MPVQNKPIIHGRDHETDGADPIRGLLPSTVSGDYPASIRELPDIRGYWRLGEGSSPYADTSGEGGSNDMELRTASSGTPMSEDVDPGLLVEAHDDGAVSFNQAGASSFGSNDPDFLETDSNANFDFSVGHPTMSVIARVKPTAAGPLDGGIAGDTRFISSSGGYGQGWALRILYPSLQAEFWRGTSSSSQQAATSFSLALDETYSIGGTYDGTLIRLYVDGVLVASVTDATTLPFTVDASDLTIGGYHSSDPSAAQPLWRPFIGVVDEVAVFGSVLTDADMAALHSSAETGEVPPGYVPIIPPGGGGPVWGPPGTEVEHGDGDPEENPVTNPGGAFAGYPEDPSGWHYAAHMEQIVLYDSSPGRFDVPPRKWTRVPFNTVRIQRTWELEVDGGYRTAFMADDRGLVEPAKNGLLLITAGMTSGDQIISGWFSIEYPMLNYLLLPNQPSTGLDYYTRAARLISTTSGQVLRWNVEPNLRAFFQWPFDGAYGIEGDAIPVYYGADNPYPVYPNWPARPLNKPLPYPKLSNAVSLDYYKTSLGNPGFGLDNLEVTASLPAGHTIALQAWQDSPWLLRFGTDKYPPYTPYNYTEEWRKRPALVFNHYYDPASIDHDTGVLL